MPAKEGEIQFKIDTGADDSIPDDDLSKLGLKHKHIKKTRKKLFGPGKQKLKCIGYVKTNFTWGDETDEQLIYVCKGIKRALLGKPAIRRFNIVELNIPENFSCADMEMMVDEETEDPLKHTETVSHDYPLLKEFPEVYKGLGKIEVGESISIKLKDGTYLTKHTVQDISQYLK